MAAVQVPQQPQQQQQAPQAQAQSWQATVIALAFLALVGVMFWRATDGDFTTIWTGVGTVVGVVTGAIPAYFFHAQATQAQNIANDASQRAEQYALLAQPPG